MKIKAIIYTSLLILAASCSKDVALSPDGECYDLPPSTSWTGYSYTYAQYSYLAPCFNPNSGDEFVYIREVRDSLVIGELRIKNIITGTDFSLTMGAWRKPNWGRNGWILFNHGDNNIWRIKSNGDSLTQLTVDGSSHDARWNYDATKYVFWQRIGSGNYYTIIADANGNHLDTLTDFSYYYGSWSNDDIKISSTYDNGNESSPAYYDFNSNQIVFPATVQVSDARDNVGDSDWFPDSRRILWNTGREINITDVVTRETRTIKYACTSKLYVWMDVSPDGQKIITSRWDQKMVGDNTVHVESNIYLMNADGSNEQKIEF